MNATRREVILSALFGAGYIGLRALATGLPAAVLLDPRSKALANVCANQATAQYLVFATSGSGDPVNANVPGSFDDPGIAHSADPAMAPTKLTLSGQSYTAAAPWATLPQAVLDRTCFFHHTTLTASHANEAKVLSLMGDIQQQEMLVSLIAGQLAPCLGTVQKEPASISGQLVTFQGRTLPPLPPTALKAVLTAPSSPLLQLQSMRDADMDRINAALKQTGNQAQRAYLDMMATSKTQLRSISQNLLQTLSTITDNGTDGQTTAAVALLQMNITPAAVITIPFGGDNHTDPNLANETKQHVSGVAAIGSLMQKLAAAGLSDKVTFVMMNVFGRNLNRPLLMGRDHLGDHHATVIIGKGIRGSVIGGPVKTGNDYAAMPIVSATGKGDMGGDISFTDTLAAVGKTIGAAAGLPQAVLDAQITGGKVVPAALAS
jgi:hypothetical protein